MGTKIEKIGGRKVCMTWVVVTEGAVLMVVAGVEEGDEEDTGEWEEGHLEGPVTVRKEDDKMEWKRVYVLNYDNDVLWCKM